MSLYTYIAPKSRATSFTLDRASYDYDYPNGLDLKPGSELHDRLRDEIWRRGVEAHRVISGRFSKWRDIDKSLRAYVRPESKKKSDHDYDEKEIMPKIVMPISYVNLETLLTYMTAAFFKYPVFQYEGVGPEDAFGAELMKLVVDHQCRKSGVLLSMHTLWRDSFAYGLGAASVMWERKFGTKVERYTEGNFEGPNVFRASVDERRIKRNQLVYEGNTVKNIAPELMLPDPGVSAHDVQEMEFFGWIEHTNYNKLLRRERDAESIYFNCKYIQHCQDARSTLSRLNNRFEDVSELSRETMTTKPVDILWMYIDLIPEEWGLGDSDDPEVWVCALAGDQVVIAAEPTNLIHNKIPVVTAAPDYDGHSSTPVSKMEIIQDIQSLVDFMFTSRIMNVRKAINDMFVVDPQLVNIYDLMDPRPGKLIRLRQYAWGRQNAVKEAVAQLAVQDVTQGHTETGDYLMQLSKNVTGATDTVSGILQHRGPRISAEAASGARESSLSRLQKMAQVISLQAHVPMADMFASHVQQLMERETYVKVVGETEQRLKKLYAQQAELDGNRVHVNPLDLIVEYDIQPSDGAIPGAENMSTWVELFTVMSQNPTVGMHFDLPKVFKHIARQAGAKNVDNFVLPRPEVVPDEQAAAQMQQGNLIPLDEYIGDGAV